MKLQEKTIKKLRQLINEEIEYRSGSDLVSFFNKLGFSDLYEQGFPSRWFYTEGKLKIINSTQKMGLCIEKLFSPINFINRFEELEKFIAGLNQYLNFDGYKVVRNRKQIEIMVLNEDTTPAVDGEITEHEFLKKEFKDISIRALKLDETITGILEQRLEEIKKCLTSKLPLATIFLCGSTLEGILRGIAENNPQKFNSALISPKHKNGKVLQFYDWKLNNFIDVAKEIYGPAFISPPSAIACSKWCRALASPPSIFSENDE